jgi:anti-anti-sigma factor
VTPAPETRRGRLHCAAPETRILRAGRESDYGVVCCQRSGTTSLAHGVTVALMPTGGLNMSLESTGGWTHVWPEGELAALTAAKFDAVLDALLTRRRPVHVHLDRLAFLDRAGARGLLMASHLALAARHRLVMSGMSAETRRALELFGALELLPLEGA